jgi:hypothetical protein
MLERWLFTIGICICLASLMLWLIGPLSLDTSIFIGLMALVPGLWQDMRKVRHAAREKEINDKSGPPGVDRAEGD